MGLSIMIIKLIKDCNLPRPESNLIFRFYFRLRANALYDFSAGFLQQRAKEEYASLNHARGARALLPVCQQQPLTGRFVSIE